MNGDEVKARRHAREIVQDLRWHGMTVPSLYGHMAWEFQELMRSGKYAAWVTGNRRGGEEPLASSPSPPSHPAATCCDAGSMGPAQPPR